MKKASNKNGFLNLRVLFACFLCLCAVSLAVAGVNGIKRAQPRTRPLAPTPPSGTISTANPTLTYSDGPFVVSNATGEAGDPVCTVPMSCSDFGLTVNIGAPDPTKQVRVAIGWPIATADFDVYVYSGFPATGSPIYSSATSSDPEVVILPAANAIYTVRVVPFAPAGQTYMGMVSLENVTPAPPPGNAPPGRYLDYPAPAAAVGAGSSGEPSVGVDWNPNVASLKIGPNPPTPGNPPMNNVNQNIGGVAFFTANLNEFRVDFDDCSSPAKNVWTDVTFPTEGEETLDPIGFVDHQSPMAGGIESGAGLGRVFQSQLAGATSITVFSDDDGATYTPSQGSGQPAGVDHETLGGGPYSPVVEPPHPLYRHQIYYASQDVGTAFAARSDDGGQTFGPGVPIYNISQCGGLHGHVKVGPDGTVYIPNKSCDSHTAVAVSQDNGVTWTVKEIPGSGTGDTDPSVGIGADNTVYVGYQNSDGHPHIAVSTGHGDTWHDVDVSQGIIANSVFPEVVAGDGDRASFGFLGTSTPGVYQGTTTFTGTWYFYIATTLDRGQTYTLVDATNGDPVQVGSICTGGTTCGGDRNLLDFNDLQLDAEGRVVGAFADGCVGPDCNSGTAAAHAPPYNESRSALGTVIRQSGGPRLLSAFDVEANCTGSGNNTGCAATVPAAPRVDQVARNGVLVNLEWAAPDNGGSPITGYHVYRKTGTIGTYALIATVTKTTYDDASATDLNAQYFYKVSAINSIGEGDTCGEFPITAGAPQETPCALPGVTILTDPTGDELDMVPGHDVQSLQIGEPFSLAPDKIVFTLKMQSLSILPPATEWPVTFNGPDSINYTVRMTNSPADGYVSGPPLFQVGPTAGTLVAADPASNYNVDGTITIIVPRSAIGNPAVGQTLTTFLSRITVGALTPDNMPDSTAGAGSYTIVGNASCSPNNPPIAAFIAYPVGGNPGDAAQGDPPLAIHFDASASHDPDPGDFISSYHFDFGDGTTSDSASPTVDHTYTNNGHFEARLTVTDNHNLSSSNVATAEIEVETPLDDVVSRKVHGTAGPFDIDLFPNQSTGAVNVECRVEGNGYKIIFTFGSEFTVTDNASSVTVSNGGTVSSHMAGPNANQYQVTLTNVTNAQSHNITLNGVPVNNSSAPANGGNATLNSVVARLDLLVGDVNNDRFTNGGDTTQVRSRSGNDVGTTNFRDDVNADGFINSGDTAIVRQDSGTALP